MVLLYACGSAISKDKQKLVEVTNHKVARIDHNHRMHIVEDEFINGDSSYMVRGYYRGDQLLKLVGVIRTPHYERDDYFYFERGKPLFTGHMVNYTDNKVAEEFKYYYDKDGIEESLYWKDEFTPGHRFSHEHFEEFEPNLDSLLNEEKKRIEFFISHLKSDGIEIRTEKEGVGAN